MAGASDGQRVARIAFGVMLVIAFVAALHKPIQILLGPAGHDLTDAEIRSSTTLPVLLWCLCVPLVVRRQWKVSVSWMLRALWLFGSVLLLLHIAIAFHRGHGWSHEAAWEHTRRVGGYGDGIFANYAFALVWLTDAVWLATAPGSYRGRPRWLHGAVHGFLAFVMVNAAVVFGSWLSRITFVGVAATCWFVLPRMRKWTARNEGEKSETTTIDKN